MEENIPIYKILEKSETTSHGENKRKIGFIVLKPHYEQHQDLLHKIITAVGLDVKSDVNIIELNDKNGRIILNELYRKSETKHFFIFGLTEGQIGVQTDMHMHYPKVTENFVIHISHSLDELANNVEKKKELWAYLKKIFK